MRKRAVTILACAAVAAAVPVRTGAQAATTPPSTTGVLLAVAPGTCDCPVGDKRGDLRDFAAFAPLGLLGALAVAGGPSGLFGSTGESTPASGVGSAERGPLTGSELRITEPGRNSVAETPLTSTTTNDRGIPEPVSQDSLRGGLRAPNTGTSLPSVLLLGTGLVAVGCVTLLRARS